MMLNAPHMAVWPPSTNRRVPVTNDASSEARNRMQAATSAGVPGRLRIVVFAAFSRYCSRVLPIARGRRAEASRTEGVDPDFVGREMHGAAARRTGDHGPATDALRRSAPP